jgi:hypothetical protein
MSPKIIPPTRNTQNGEVVGLGRTGGENELARIGTDECGYLATRLLDEIGCDFAEIVRAG